MKYEDLTIITPTLNEEENISKLIPILQRLYPKATIIVSDDCSKDNTQKIVSGFSKKNRRIKLMDRRQKKIKGLTASVLDAVIATKTPYLVVMDSDLQHPPEKVAEIYSKLKQNYDIVIGSRRKVEGDWGVYRKTMSKTATWLAIIRLLRYVKDPMSGFCGVKTRLFKEKIKQKRHRFVETGFKFLFDLLKISPRAKVGEIFYVFDLRKHGESKIGKRAIKAFLKSLI